MDGGGGERVLTSWGRGEEGMELICQKEVEKEGTDLRTKIPRQNTRHICSLQASFHPLGMTVVATVTVAGSAISPFD